VVEEDLLQGGLAAGQRCDLLPAEFAQQPGQVSTRLAAQFVRADLPLLPVELVQRAAFQSMTYTGTPPWRQDGGEQAAANVASLADAVLAIIGMTPGLPVPGGQAMEPVHAPALRVARTVA